MSEKASEVDGNGDIDAELRDADQVEVFKMNGEGEIERDGLLFCFACGMLAAHGDEEYDFCDHRTGYGCSYNDETFEDDDRFDEDDDYFDDDMA